MANDISIKVGLDFDKKSYNELKKSLQAIQQQAKQPSAGGQMSAELKKSAQEAKKLEQILDKSWNSKLNQLDLSKFNSSLKESQWSLKEFKSNMSSIGPEGAASFNKIASSALFAKTEIKQSSKVLDEMATSFKNTVKWGISSSVFNEMTGAIQKAYGYTKKLDGSLNDIRIVTDKSAESMEQFAKQANQAAKGLGASTLDYTKASLIYYQQGLGDQDVQARAETTLKAANVTGQTGDEVSEQLTAVWNGYKVSAQETELYIDKLAAVAASTASDLEELSTGMSKVASAAAMMGVNIDQLDGMLATVISVTRQAPESAGTAFKTIFARMEDLQLGKTDEEGVGLGEVSSSLAQMGVNILDAQGNMRELGGVIEEVGQKWNSGVWSDAEKQALAIDLAGKRQYNNLLALFDNWEMYNQAVQTSQNAAGTLNEQNEIYMDSIAAHMQVLRTTAEESYDIIFNPESVNAVTDALTGLLEVFNTFMKSLGGGVNMLIAFGAAATKVFNKQIARSISSMLVNKDIKNNNTQVLATRHAFLREGADTTGMSQAKKVAWEEAYQNVSSIDQNKEIFGSEIYNQQLADQERLLKNKLRIAEINKDIDTNEREDIKELKKERDGLISTYEEEIGIKARLDKQVHDSPTNPNREKTLGILGEAKDRYQGLLDEAKIKVNSFEGDTKSNEYKELEKEAKRYQTVVEQIKEAEKQLNKAINTNQKDKTDANKAVIQSTEKAINLIEKESQITKQLKENAEEEYNRRKGASFEEVEELESENRVIEDNANSAKNIAEREQAVQSMVNIGSSLVMTGTTLMGVYKTLSDDTISLGDKIASVSTSLVFMIPILTGLLKELTIENAKKMAKVLDKGTNAIMNWGEANKGKSILQLYKNTLNGIKSGSIGKITKSFSGILTAIKSILPLLLKFIAPIAAIGVAVYGLYKYVNRFEDKVKKTQQHLNSTKDSFTKATEASNNFANSLKNYKDGVKNLEELDKGGQEYQERLRAINEEAIKLLNTHKELAIGATYNDEGILTFDPEQEKKIQDKLTGDVLGTQSVYLKASEENTKAQIDLDKSNFLSSDKVDSTQLQLYGTPELNTLLSKAHDQLEKTGNLVLGAEVKDASYETFNTNELDYIKQNKDAFTKLAETTYAQNKAQEVLTQGYLDAAYKLAHPEETKKKDDGKTSSEEALFRGEVLKYQQNNSAQDKEKNNYIAEHNLKGLIGGIDENAVAKVLMAEQGGVDYKVHTYSPGGHYQNNDVEIYDDKGEVIYKGNLDDYLQSQANENHIKDIDVSEEAKARDKIFSDNEYLLGESLNNFKELLNSTSEGVAHLDKNMSQEDAISLLDFFNKNEEGLTRLFEENPELISTMGFDKDATVEEILEALEQGVQNRASQSDASVFSQEQINGMKTSMDTVALQGSSGDLNYRNAQSNKDYTNMVDQVKELVAVYPELNEQAEIFSNEALIGSAEWTLAAEAIQAKIDAIDFSKKVDEFEDTTTEMRDTMQEAWDSTFFTKAMELDDDYTIPFNAVLEDEEFQQQFDAFLEQDHKLTVEVVANDSGILEDFNSHLNDIQTQFEKIGSNFNVKAEDLFGLNQAMPGILDNMQQLEDGSVRLNETAVKEAKDAKKEELKAEYEAMKAKINANITALKSKRNGLRAMLQVVQKSAKGEKISSKDVTKYKKGQAQVEAANANIKANEEIYAQSLVATNSKDNAKVTAENYNEAYKKAAEAAQQFAEKAAKAQKDAAKGKSPGSFSWSDISTSGLKSGKKSSKKSGGIKGLLDKFFDGIDLGLKSEIEDGAAEQVKELQNQIDGLGSQISIEEGNLAALDGIFNSASKNLDSIASGNGSTRNKSKSSGGSKAADPDHIEYLKDEYDRYHDINIELKEYDNNLKEIQFDKKKAYGSDLKTILDKELDTLKQQNKAHKTKLDLLKEEAKEKRKDLSNKGVTFDADGQISNYTQIYKKKLAAVNAVIKKYNSMSAEEQKKYKQTVETAKKSFEEFVKEIENYDKIINEEIEKEREQIRSNLEAQISAQIEAFNIDLKLSIDSLDFRKAFNNFKREVLQDAEDDDLYTKGENQLNDYDAYFTTGKIETQTDTVNKIKEEIQKMQNGQVSDIFSAVDPETGEVVNDMKAAQEALDKATKDLMKDLIDLDKLQEDLFKTFLQSIDAVQKGFDKGTAQIEYMNKTLNHHKKMIELLYGKEAYDKMNKFYESEKENINKNISYQESIAAYWKEKLDNARKNGAKDEEIQKYEENYKKANDNIMKSLEDLAQNVLNTYKNTVNTVYKELEDKITSGKGLDFINEELKLVQKNANNYLDDINSAFQLNDLENKWKDAIDGTSSVEAQKKLTDAMNQQLDGLKAKDKLTKHDIERAEKQYQIALKQIALEEAQQNKSKMRLQRDTQGNYSYQFVSDEDSIRQAQADLEKAKNDLYNFDKDAFNKNLNDALSAYQEYIKKRQDIEIKYKDDEQKRTEYLALLDAQYEEQLNFLMGQNTELRLNLMDSAVSELESLYGLDVENFQNMTQAEKDAIMEDLVPAWTGGVQEMIDRINNEEDGLSAVMAALETQLKTARDQYKEDMDVIKEKHTTTFESIKTEDEIITKEIQKQNTELQIQYTNLQNLITKAQELADKYKSITDAAKAAAQAIADQKAAEDKKRAEEAAKKKAEEEAKKPKPTTPKPKPPAPKPKPTTPTLREGSSVTVKPTARYWGKQSGGLRMDDWVPGSKFTVYELFGSQVLLGRGGIYTGWINKNDLVGFRSGGYTGSWDESGKLALLHQKEMVLNKDDTKNMLGAIDILRNITSSIGKSALNSFHNMTDKLVPSKTPNTTPINDVFEQQVNITANFEGKTEAEEIQTALNNLVNIATQRANRR